MIAKGEATLLKIYISNTDKFKHSPLYEMVVFAAKRYGLGGATVLKGVMGFGSSSVIHSVNIWELSEKLPVVIEIVGESGEIDGFLNKILPWFEKIRYGSLITTEKINVEFFKQGHKRK